MEINLIPVKLRPKRPSRAPYLFVSMVYILSLLCFGTRIGTVERLKRETASDRALLGTLNSNLDFYKGSKEKLESVNSAARELIAVKRSFADVHENKLPLGSIIREVTCSTPEGLLFEELEIAYPAEELLLKGFGKDGIQEKVLAFKYSLEANSVIKEHFRSVSAVLSSVHPGSDRLKTFEIKMVFGQ